MKSKINFYFFILNYKILVKMLYSTFDQNKFKQFILFYYFLYFIFESNWSFYEKFNLNGKIGLGFDVAVLGF